MRPLCLSCALLLLAGAAQGFTWPRASKPAPVSLPRSDGAAGAAALLLVSTLVWPPTLASAAPTLPPPSASSPSVISPPDAFGNAGDLGALLAPKALLGDNMNSQPQVKPAPGGRFGENVESGAPRLGISPESDLAKQLQKLDREIDVGPRSHSNTSPGR